VKHISSNNFILEKRRSFSFCSLTFSWSHIIFLLIISLARERILGLRRSRPILMNPGAIACVWQWRSCSETQPRLPGLQAFMKACKSVDYPRRDASRILPAPRRNGKKVHLLSGSCVDLKRFDTGTMEQGNLLRHVATVISKNLLRNIVKIFRYQR